MPTVSSTFPTNRLLIEVNTEPNVTVLPDTEQVKVLIEIESTAIERQVTFDVSVNAEGKIILTVALRST